MANVLKKHVFIDSHAKDQKLHVMIWRPDGGYIKGILQIVHGMVEHIERYDAFAAFLAENGYVVVGHDQLGHGLTATDPAELGFFAEKEGDKLVINDIHRVTNMIKNTFPGVRHIIMGHSMGSYFTRKYLTKYGKDTGAAIIMGTGIVPAPVAAFGQTVAAAICKVKGSHYRSKLLVDLSLGSNNKKIENPKTANDWLSVNEENVEKYNADPLCGYMFTASAYHDFFKILKELGQKKGADAIPRALPVLFISGEEDPVGSYGTAVTKISEEYKEMGMQKVSLILYPGDRHEILNENDKEKVFADILAWLEA